MSFVSSFFNKISISRQYLVIWLYNAVEGILERCCFAEVSPCLSIYGTGLSTSWSLPKSSLNSTVTKNCRGEEASFWGGYNKFAFFYNNNSHLFTVSLRSCYCHVRTPQNRNDINCFFSGSSCNGPYPVDLHSDLSGCIISKFNFVNNSDPDGYFWIINGNIYTAIKESVISYSSTNAKWIYNVNSHSTVAIMCSFIIAEEEPQANQYVSTVNVQLVNKASTFGQFHGNPGRRECNSISKNFSHTLSVKYLSFLLLSLTIPATSPA